MNDFTTDFVDKFYKALDAAGKANKNKVFKIESFKKYFKTIQALNHAGSQAVTIIGNHRVEDYEIPEFLRDLIVPKVTPSGGYGEVALFEFAPVQEKDVMPPLDFNTFGRIMYGLYRKDFEGMTPVEDYLNKPADFALYSKRITDVKGEYVGDTFEMGQYPLKPKYEFLLPESMGMEKSRAEDRWIKKKIDDLAQ